ncbi:MAG: DUF2905 domain-containing protein [Candidatus Hydrogenedentes bacterium]|nr:DUF2905 domain-containing protein [Candidatus Hydrogenedentota bacterium]
MDLRPLALLLIGAGILIALLGVFLYFGSQLNFPFLGKLPGDIRIERENFRFYFPITMSILLSLVLTLIVFLISKLRG